MKDSGVDIFCLQRILYVDIQRQIYQGLRQTYPYVYSGVDFSSEFDKEKPACTQSDMQRFGACVKENCTSADEDVPKPACIFTR